MRSLGFAVGLVALVGAPGVAAPYVPRVLSAAEAQADVALMRRGLETVHPGLYRYSGKAEIDAAFARLEAAVRGPVTELALHGAMSLMLAVIHCDHTKAEMSDALVAFRETEGTHLPFRFRLIEGRMIVVSGDGQAGAPPVGSEVLTINGMAAPAVLPRLGAAVAYDGDTDQAIAAKLGDDSDLQGDDFNEYYPGLFGMPEAWDIGWKAVGAKTAGTARLRPISFAAWRALAAPGAAYRAEFYKAVRWQAGRRAAVLAIDTFVNYRNPVQPTAFLGGFFKAMRAAGTQHLILDLRANGGGSEDAAVGLARHLLAGPFLWSKPPRLKAIRYGDLPEHIESWGDRAAVFMPPEGDFVRTADGWFERKPVGVDGDDAADTVVQTPLAERFEGRLTILTGPRNGSGATRTIAQLKERRGAVLVGEDSAGSAEGPTAGKVFLMTLPNSGLKLRIARAWNRTAIERFVPRLGVPVDVAVMPTLADHEAGRDRALAVAMGEDGAAADAPAVLRAALEGHWAGTLDYRNYADDGRVVLPVVMAAAAGALAWTYDDGPGKTVRSAEHWAIDAGGRTLTVTGGKTATGYAVREFRRAKDGAVTLVADGRGAEAGVAVTRRVVLTLEGGRLRISQLSQRRGAPMLLRNCHELRRV